MRLPRTSWDDLPERVRTVWPTLPGPLERIVPEGGADICGVYIPGAVRAVRQLACAVTDVSADRDHLAGVYVRLRELFAGLPLTRSTASTAIRLFSQTRWPLSQNDGITRHPR